MADLNESVSGEPEGAESPVEAGVGAGSPDTDLLGKFKAANLDLSELDPDEVSQALEFKRQASGKKLLSDEEIDRRSQQALAARLSDPNVRQQLAAYLKQFPDVAGAQSPPEELPDDPTERELALLKRSNAEMSRKFEALLGGYQSLQEQLERGQKVAQAKESADGISSRLNSVVSSMPAAEKYGPALRKLLTADISLGNLTSQDVQTEAGMRRWVKRSLATFPGSDAQKVLKGGSPVVPAKDPKDMNDEEWDAWANSQLASNRS